MPEFLASICRAVLLPLRAVSEPDADEDASSGPSQQPVCVGLEGGNTTCCALGTFCGSSKPAE